MTDQPEEPVTVHHAQHVNGLAVVASEPAPSQLKRDGKPVPFKQILRLLLADGSEVYGCVHCDYTSPNPNSVRPHLNAHRNGKPPLTAGGVDVREVLRRLNAVDGIQADRDRWRDRAITAERDLSNLRRAFERAGLSARSHG